MSTFLQQIPVDLKSAREFTLLGNYTTADVYFQGVVANMKREMNSASAGERAAWKAALAQVEEEYELLKSVSSELNSFKTETSKPTGGGRRGLWGVGVQGQSAQQPLAVRGGRGAAHQTAGPEIFCDKQKAGRRPWLPGAVLPTPPGSVCGATWPAAAHTGAQSSCRC